MKELTKISFFPVLHVKCYPATLRTCNPIDAAVGASTMGKMKVDNSTRVFPMPMVVVGALVDGKNNYLAVAWIC